MTAEKKEVRLAKLPIDFLMSITKSVADYSVVLYRGDQQIGSGTLVNYGGIKGILTAHHVVHRISPPLDLSVSSTDILLLAIIESRHTFELPASSLIEIEIAVPLCDEWGPDITFLRIPNGSKLASLEAIKSFWRMDYDIQARLMRAEDDLGLWVTMGQPNELESSYLGRPNTLHIEANARAFFGFATKNRRVKKDGFDYADTIVNYNSKDPLPASFEGISGGGLWKTAITLVKSEWRFEAPMLCGLAFYQEWKSDTELIVRCHYAESIYKHLPTELTA